MDYLPVEERVACLLMGTVMYRKCEECHGCPLSPKFNKRLAERWISEIDLRCRLYRGKEEEKELGR